MLQPAQQAVEVLRFLSNHPVEKIKVGQSSHSIIHRQNKAAVRYFAPAAGVDVRHPVFISMPLINTWTIFDLLPGKSLVAALTGAGAPVYLLDWGNPGPEDAAQTLSDTIDSILVRAMSRSRRHAVAQGTMTADQGMDAIGYCVGGTFLSICLARHPGYARSMALLASPIDFHASGRLATWAREETFPLDAIIDNLGNFPAELMRSSFSMLKPTGQVTKWKTLFDRIDRDGFQDVWSAMEKWSSANTEFPGETYREYVRRCYFDNALMTGDWTLAGSPVDLSQGKIPALAIGASSDHICPPAAAHGLATVWGGDVQTETVRGGHVGVCIGRSLPTTLLTWLDAQ